MKITIEVSSHTELEKIILFFQTLKLDSVRIITDSLAKKSDKNISMNITKGDKSIDPTSLFGVWKDNPRSLEQIREQGWKRKPIL